ncbi:MAG: hypothetical protein NDJ90_09510 [Oligoflexia bacterium]|nr:hypothetical protein [Oligoflexia bacterium]
MVPTAPTQAAEWTQNRGKKILYLGWHVPTTRWFSIPSNRESVKKLPIDGTAVDILIDRSYYSPENTLGRQLLSPRAFSVAEPAFQAAISDMSQISSTHLTDNMMNVALGFPGQQVETLTWFDNARWATAANNWKTLAAIGNQMRARGFLVDVEGYSSGALFDLAKQKQRDGGAGIVRSDDEYRRLAGQRGYEIMSAVQAVFPNSQFLFLWSYTAARPDPLGRVPADWHTHFTLLPAFLDGMLRAIPASSTTRIIDGYEFSYYHLDQPSDSTVPVFQAGRNEILNGAVSLSKIPDLYRSRVSASFGLYLDWARDSALPQWKPGNRQHSDPEEWGRVVGHALEQADQYVWIYSENAVLFDNINGFAASNIEAEYLDAQWKAKGYDRTVIGNIDGIFWSNGAYWLHGWACQKYNSTPISIHLYFGGTAGQEGASGYNGMATGLPAPGYLANLPSEPAVAEACESKGVNHRFSINLNPYLVPHGGQSVHVHGINPFGFGNPVISRSGVLAVPSPIRGQIDGVFERDGQFEVRGWACRVGSPDSIPLHLYLGGSAGTAGSAGFNGMHTGLPSPGYVANLASEPAVATACGGTGTRHRFRIPLAPYLPVYRGQPVYVYGMSTVGGGHRLLERSGLARLPELDIIGAVESIVVEGGAAQVRGWACLKGSSRPINLHLYLGGAAGSSADGFNGTATGLPSPGYLADLVSTSAIAASCGSTGMRHGFSIPLAPYLASYAGKPIFIHGINPFNLGNPLLSNSGSLQVP